MTIYFRIRGIWVQNGFSDSIYTSYMFCTGYRTKHWTLQQQRTLGQVFAAELEAYVTPSRWTVIDINGPRTPTRGIAWLRVRFFGQGIVPMWGSEYPTQQDAFRQGYHLGHSHYKLTQKLPSIRASRLSTLAKPEWWRTRIRRNSMRIITYLPQTSRKQQRSTRPVRYPKLIGHTSHVSTRRRKI